MPVRSADAQWEGPLQGGKGHMRFGGGAFDGAYSFSSRFEDGQGTNPEELIAAAHAGCFSMALSAGLGKSGFNPTRVATIANVTLDKVGEGFKITTMVLTVRAKVANVDAPTFRKIADATKDGCPVSGALKGNVAIDLNASLES